MPSKSDKQKRLMAAVANNPEFAKKVGIPQSVGKEFQREDKKMNCGSKRKMMGGGKVMNGYKKGGFPDLNKDGKVTQADILKGRGVTNMSAGGKVRGAGMAKKGVRPCQMR